MWQKTVTTHSDGRVGETTVTCLSGAIGQTGATGPQGPTGAKGKGVKSIVPQYYLSTSATAQAGGSWSDKDPGWVSGKYIWTRSHVTYDDGSTEDTTAVLANTLNSANSTAARAKSTADTANSTANTAKSTADSAKTTATAAQSTANAASSTATAAQSTANAVDKVITDWCYTNSRTYINGGKIYTGTVTANQIAANAITTEKLATDAIKSKNYAYTSGNFSTAGTFLDLSNGVIRSKNFGLDASGNAHIKGEVDATSLSVQDSVKIYTSGWAGSTTQAVVFTHKANLGTQKYDDICFGSSVSNKMGFKFGYVDASGVGDIEIPLLAERIDATYFSVGKGITFRKEVYAAQSITSQSNLQTYGDVITSQGASLNALNRKILESTLTVVRGIRGKFDGLLPQNGDAAFVVCQRLSITDTYVFVAHMYNGLVKVADVYKTGSFSLATNNLGSLQVRWGGQADTIGECIAFKWKLAGG